MSETETVDRLHNQPPIALPKEEEMHADLERKYPEIQKELGEFDKAFKSYPEELTLKDEEVAKGLSDLILQAKKAKKAWKAYGSDEKGPLNKLVKVVTNFFTSADEKLKALLEKYEPVLEDYSNKVRDEKVRLAEEAAAAQRRKEEEARKAAEEQERLAREAEEAAEKKRQEEAEARAAAEKAKREREEAEARAAAAKEAERKAEIERRERERVEKEKNSAGIRDARAQLKMADRLNDLAEAEEATAEELAALEQQIKPGGIISVIMGPVAASPLLTDEQIEHVDIIRNRLVVLRMASDARVTKREQKRREKERAEEEKRQAELVERRRREKEEHDLAMAEAEKRRIAEEEAAAKARAEKAEADAAARRAREEARSHEAEARAASKGAGRASDDADRAANRADRIENRLEKQTPADQSRVRGDLGSTSSLTRSWKPYIDDEDLVRGRMGPLGPHLKLEAIEAALFWYMRAHQAGFSGERVTAPELPGVHFALETDLRTT